MNDTIAASRSFTFQAATISGLAADRSGMTLTTLSKLPNANSLRMGSSFLLMACFANSACFGQGPQPLVPGTIVTGQCQGQGGAPGCVLPNLFGPTGLTVFPNPGFPHYAHFIGSAQTTLNQT